MTKRVGRRSPPPTSNPRGNKRPPHPYPPTTYPYPSRNRSAEIITISLLVAAFLLLGVGGMLWFIQTRIAFGPTPTPTPTRGATATSTPDFLATRVAEDFLTQQAYQMAVLGTTTPTPLDLIPSAQTQEEENTPEFTNTPVIVLLPDLGVGATSTAEATFPAETPTGNILNLPVVVDRSPLATATPTPILIAEVPTETPFLPPTPEPPPADIATEIPTETLPLPVDTLIPTPTEIVIPPSPTPVPPGQPFVVASLHAFVQNNGAGLRLGPSNVYTEVLRLAPQTRVNAIGRNASGEWLYICCVENQSNITPMWVRQSFVRPSGNEAQSGAPEGYNPNDVRWLRFEPPPAYLPLVPALIPAGPDDFPLYRYDRQGAGRVDQLPNAPFGRGWGAEAQAGGPFGSSVAVMGATVIAGSSDNHLYGFERSTGSQRWRYNLGANNNVVLAPMIYDNEIFFADQNRTVRALNNQIPPVGLWQVSLPQPALTSLNNYSDTIYIAVGEGNNHTLLALDRDNGAVRWEADSTGPGLRYPVIGDQLVYAADGVIRAHDVINGNLVWENTSVVNIMIAPAYGSPGPSSLAELYLFTNDNRIFALDANTGVELWNLDNGEGATSLALNENTLFVAGDSYVKAYSRQDRTVRWRSPIGGPLVGGLLVDANRALVITQSGTVHLFDNQNGSAIAVPSIDAPAGGGPAVSGPYIFVPGTDGRLHELLGN